SKAWIAATENLRLPIASTSPGAGVTSHGYRRRGSLERRAAESSPGSMSSRSRLASASPGNLPALVRYAVQHMPCCDVPGGGLDVVGGVVEEDVRAEGFQKRTLVAPTEEQGLVQAHAPMPQREDHAFVGRGGACGDQRGAQRRGFRREGGLDLVQG